MKKLPAERDVEIAEARIVKSCRDYVRMVKGWDDTNPEKAKAIRELFDALVIDVRTLNLARDRRTQSRARRTREERGTTGGRR